jgi:EmrB/QacA subfamily drug resistance transporter
MKSNASISADGELSRRAVIASLVGIIAAMLMAALDATIVGTAMPRVIADLHGFEHYTAVTTVYLLASTVVVPIAGKLSDLYGRKPFLLVGVAIFGIASALCGAAQSMTQLVLFRGIQGLGGGIAQGMAFTTIADLFPPARRGRVSGMMGSVFGLASVAGPAIGGFLTDGPGWRWCFYVNIPVGIAAFIVLLLEFPHVVATRKERPSIDWLGASALVLGVVPVLLALSWGGRDYVWSSPVIVSLLSFGLLMILLFLRAEMRAKEAIIPPAMFRHRVIWTSAVAATAVAMAMFGTSLFIPLFIQGVIGTSATRSGAVLTPMMITMIAASMTSGQLVSRFGKYKAIAVVGVAATGLGMFLLARMDVSTTYATVLRNMMVMGAGLGMTMPIFTLSVQNAVDIRQVGVATSSVQFLRTMGGSIGAAIFGAVLSNRFAPALQAALPPGAARALPPGTIGTLSNPQALLNPAVVARMNASPAAAPVLAALKRALASSLHEVFLVGAVIVAGALVVTCLLVDVPLRTSNRRTAPKSKDDGDGPLEPLPQFEL